MYLQTLRFDKDLTCFFCINISFTEILTFVTPSVLNFREKLICMIFPWGFLKLAEVIAVKPHQRKSDIS